MIARYGSVSSRQRESALLSAGALKPTRSPLVAHQRSSHGFATPSVLAGPLSTPPTRPDVVRARHRHLADSLSSSRPSCSASRPFHSSAGELQKHATRDNDDDAPPQRVVRGSPAGVSARWTTLPEPAWELERAGTKWKGKGRDAEPESALAAEERQRQSEWDHEQAVLAALQTTARRVSQARRDGSKARAQSLDPPADPPPLDDLGRQPPSPPLPTYSPPTPDDLHDCTVRAFYLRRLSRLPPTESLVLSDLLTIYEELLERGLLADVGVANALVFAALSRDRFHPARKFLRSILAEMKAANRPAASLVAAIEAPMRHLQRREIWEFVRRFSQLAVTERVVSHEILRMRMRALFEAGRYKDAIRTFDLFAEVGIEPDDAALDELVCAHLKNGDLEPAHAILARKEERKFPTTERTVLAILDGMREFGGNPQMEAMILSNYTPAQLTAKTALRQNVKVLNRIMSIRAERETLQPALRVLEYFNLKALPRPLPVAAVTLGVERPYQLHIPYDSQPPRRAPPSAHWRPMPDAATFSILMSIALRRKYPSVALQLFVESQALQLGMNESLVAQLVRTVLVHAGPVEAERFVFELDLGTAKLPGVPGYTVPQFEPTPFVYEVLLSSVLAYGGLRGASALFGRMAETTKRKVEVSEGLVAGLVKYLAQDRRGDPLEASSDFLARMNVLTAGVRKPTIANLNDLIKSVWQRERFQTVGRFAKPHAGLASPGGMRRVRTSLDDREVKDDSATVQQLLRHGALDSPADMWEYLQTEVIDRGAKPTRHHICVIMRAFIKQGDLDGARATLRRALALGVERHVSFYSVLIGGHSRLGSRNEVQALVREMREEGIAPDRSLYAALAFSASRERSPQALRSVLREAKAVVPDIEIDPVFVMIEYRALSSAGRRLHAQILLRQRLARGLVPDRAVSVVLRRTTKFENRKANKSARATPQELKSRRLLRTNVHTVRSLDDRSTQLGGLKELKQLEGFLDLVGGKGRRPRRLRTAVDEKEAAVAVAK